MLYADLSFFFSLLCEIEAKNPVRQAEKVLDELQSSRYSWTFLRIPSFSIRKEKSENYLIRQRSPQLVRLLRQNTLVPREGRFDANLH